MTEKEQIKCKYKFQDKEKFDGKTYCTCFCELCEDLPLCDDNCQIYEDFKQLARKTQECEALKKRNEDNERFYLKQYAKKDSEVLDLTHQLNVKTRECERLKSYGATLLADKNAMEIGRDDYLQRCKQLEQECEELKEEILTKNEKIKELRFSVSDLTNRLCYLNAEKSFRIVDLEQTLDEIEKELKEDIYCESQECGCDDFEECLKCTKEHILDIIKTIDK